MDMDMRIGVVRGGHIDERTHSLALGGALLQSLRDASYDTVDIFIDDKGIWWHRGVATQPAHVLDTLSLLIPAFPGASPIAARVMTLAAQYGIPYVGGSPTQESIASHPEMRSRVLAEASLATPRTVSLQAYDAPTADEIALTIVRTHPLPVRFISIPAYDTSHLSEPLGNVIAIRDALTALAPGARDILLEEDVKGIHVTVYLIDGFRGKERYIFPPVSTISRAPSLWSREEGRDAERVARIAVDTLSLGGFVRVDMTITPKKIVIRDIRTTPDFRECSPLYDALEAVGATKKEIVEHIVNMVVGGVV
jgi:D-alanine-D-alanine ligase-like ATP-grasp enzyme